MFDARADEHSCGGRLSETTDKAIVWTAEPDGYCHRCYALAYKQHLYANAKNPEAPGDKDMQEARRHAAVAARLWRSDPMPAGGAVPE